MTSIYDKPMCVWHCGNLKLLMNPDGSLRVLCHGDHGSGQEILKPSEVEVLVGWLERRAENADHCREKYFGPEYSEKHFGARVDGN